MKIKLLCLVSLIAFTGCMTAIKQGDIVSITERFIGFKVSQSQVNQTPQVQFGFGSSVVVLIPTTKNTNANGMANIATPNFANTFDFNQTGALQLGITEDVVAGNFSTLRAGATNSANTTQPVVPK